MPQIRPIKDLRNTTEISEVCHASDEPVFITKNGYGDLVIMSMKTYEQKMGMLEIYRKLDEAEEDIAAGRVMDARTVFDELRSKYHV